VTPHRSAGTFAGTVSTWDEIMGLMAKNGGSSRTPAPAGTHVATCFGLVDLGTQVGSYQGKETRRHQCWVWWELADEVTEDGKPVTVGGFYTVSLNEKAGLRKVLEAWRGRPFTADELNGFHLTNIVGKPCMLTIIHEEKQGGGVRDKIAGVTAVPKSVKPAPAKSKTVMLSLDDGEFDRAVYDGLPNFLKDMILKSDEGQMAVNGVRPARHQPGQHATAGTAVDEAEGDGIPF
jgi:hypothetical protein